MRNHKYIFESGGFPSFIGIFGGIFGVWMHLWFCRTTFCFTYAVLFPTYLNLELDIKIREVNLIINSLVRFNRRSWGQNLFELFKCESNQTRGILHKTIQTCSLRGIRRFLGPKRSHSNFSQEMVKNNSKWKGVDKWLARRGFDCGVLFEK